MGEMSFFGTLGSYSSERIKKKASCSQEFYVLSPRRQLFDFLLPHQYSNEEVWMINTCVYIRICRISIHIGDFMNGMKKKKGLGTKVP